MRPSCNRVLLTCLSPGVHGVDALVPRLSFSAALSVPMERAGTILFDKVFVNEGDFYDPRTGERGLSGVVASPKGRRLDPRSVLMLKCP